MQTDDEQRQEYETISDQIADWHLRDLLDETLAKRTTLLVFGAFGVLTYIGHLAHELFKDSVWFPATLALCGLMTLFAAAYLQRHGTRIDTVFDGYRPARFVNNASQCGLLFVIMLFANGCAESHEPARIDEAEASVDATHPSTSNSSSSQPTICPSEKDFRSSADWFDPNSPFDVRMQDLAWWCSFQTPSGCASNPSLPHDLTIDRTSIDDAGDFIKQMDRYLSCMPGWPNYGTHEENFDEYYRVQDGAEVVGWIANASTAKWSQQDLFRTKDDLYATERKLHAEHPHYFDPRGRWISGGYFTFPGFTRDCVCTEGPVQDYGDQRCLDDIRESPWSHKCDPRVYAQIEYPVGDLWPQIRENEVPPSERSRD